MSEGKNRELSIIVTVAAVAAFPVLDFLLFQVFRNMHGDRDWLGLAVGGLFTAQTMLIAIWAVFAPVNVVLRLSSWLFFGLWTWYTIVFATLEPNEGLQRAQSRESAVFGLVVLLGVTLLQIPLWIAKRALRFRMIRPGEPPTPVASERLQFQLKDLLLATFILAIALSPIRLVLPERGFDGMRLFPGMHLAIPVAMAVILFATLPSVWAAFVGRPAVLLAVWLAIYQLLVTGIEFGIVCAFAGFPPRLSMFAEAFGASFMGNLAQCGVVFLVMRIYYALGFRLQRVPRRAAPPPVDMALPNAAETSIPQVSTDAN